MARRKRSEAAVRDSFSRCALRRVISERGEAERAALFEAAARSVGVENAEDVRRFRETISAIFEATREPGSGFRRR